MKTRHLPFAAALLLLATGPALAGSATDELTRLYRLDLTISACPGSSIDAQAQSRLDDAIDKAEAAAGLDDDARQKLYDGIEAAAEKDVDAFCKAEAPGVAASIAALPGKR